MRRRAPRTATTIGTLEARALVGKDVIGHAWARSPDSGLALRHLSNGTAGVAGYRTDEYVYVPLWC